MADNTKIEWATASWSPVTGCTKISPGCKNCYAERMSKRLAGRFGYPAVDSFRVTLHPDKLDQPFKWKKPRRIFVCSMGDLFHDDVPINFIHRVFHAAENAPQHTYLFLTKRPKRMAEIIKNHWWINKPRFPNWWLGVTAENQEQADKRIPILLQIPAAVRFVSVEPLLSAVDIGRYLLDNDDLDLSGGWPQPDGLNFVIAGGESGPGARPCHPDWVRSLRDQCQEASVPFMFKQWGEWWPLGQVSNKPDGKDTIKAKRERLDHGILVYKRGKKIAGRLLDGIEYMELPT